MCERAFLLTSVVLFFVVSAESQCPQPGLWNRLIYLRDSERNHPEKELPKLLKILDSVNHCPYSDDSTHSFLLHRLARIYVDQGEFVKAIQFYRGSIGFLTHNSQGTYANRTRLPGRYFYLSVAYDSLGNFSEKMKALDSCLTIAIRFNYQDRSSLKAMEIWTQYFFDIGDYQKCIDYSKQWETAAKKYADDSTGMEHVVGEVSGKSALGWRIKAMLQVKDFKSADELLENKIEEYKKLGRKDYLGMIYGQLALVEEQKGHYDQALTNFLHSLRYYQDTADNFNCKQTAKDIGDLYFKHFNDADGARAFYRKALTFVNKDKSRATADIFESLNVYGNLANVHVQRGNYDSALKYFQLAYDQIEPGTDENKILDTPVDVFRTYGKIHYVTALQIDKGDAFQKLNKDLRRKDLLEKSISIYKKTDQLLDRIKSEQSEIESKLFWRSDSRRLYEHAIEACDLAGDIDNAFYFFEKSRAVLLQDQLNEQRWLEEGDIMKQAQLNKKIVHLQKELDTVEKNSKHFADLQDEMFTTKQEFGNVRESVKTNNPLYFQNFMNGDSITIDDVRRKILNNHQGIVELFAGDSALYVLAMTKEKSYLQKINKTAFENLSAAYISYLSDQDLLNRSFDSFTDISSQLYQLIFRNISLPPGRIIISPDSRYFPFESLITRKQPLSYFVENFAVSYTYSARYLLNNFSTNPSIASGSFFGVAPVEFSKGFAALQGSDQSLQRMRRYFRSTTNFVGANATRNNFLKEYYRYKIVQLYTHATDSGSSGDPEIYFADSTLALSDLFYENKPASSLIVLSACETAEGKLYNGEGVFSFNRQFAALGIPSCVSTLWQANNQSTYSITELFYKYLAKGEPLDVALQAAKKEFIHTSSREDRLPYYWAAPILVGQSGTVELPRKFPWLWTSAAALLALIGVGAWQVTKRKTQKSRKPAELVLNS